MVTLRVPDVGLNADDEAKHSIESLTRRSTSDGGGIDDDELQYSLVSIYLASVLT